MDEMTVPSKPRAQQEKQERLARALRENLKKRKQQQREQKLMYHEEDSTPSCFHLVDP